MAKKVVKEENENAEESRMNWIEMESEAMLIRSALVLAITMVLIFVLKETAIFFVYALVVLLYLYNMIAIRKHSKKDGYSVVSRMVERHGFIGIIALLLVFMAWNTFDINGAYLAFTMGIMCFVHWFVVANMLFNIDFSRFVRNNNRSNKDDEVEEMKKDDCKKLVFDFDKIVGIGSFPDVEIRVGSSGRYEIRLLMDNIRTSEPCRIEYLYISEIFEYAYENGMRAIGMSDCIVLDGEVELRYGKMNISEILSCEYVKAVIVKSNGIRVEYECIPKKVFERIVDRYCSKYFGRFYVRQKEIEEDGCFMKKAMLEFYVADRERDVI